MLPGPGGLLGLRLSGGRVGRTANDVLMGLNSFL